MAQGISQRTRLSLPRVPDELTPMANVLERWGNHLPFASVGFNFYRSTNETVLATGVDRTITWDTAITDQENWMPVAGTVQSIVVPPGLSGLYVFRFNVYWVAALAAITAWIRVDGAAVSNVHPGQTSATVGNTLTAIYPVQDGSVITAGVFNGSPGNITITNDGGSAFNYRAPSFAAYRIALLG